MNDVVGGVFYTTPDPSPKGQGVGRYDTILHDTEGVEPGKWFLTLGVRN
jgi:hypothetical protein